MLDYGEQGWLGRDQAAGGEKSLVPAGIEFGSCRGQCLVQLAEDGAGQLAVSKRGQVGRPQLGLGLDRRGLLAGKARKKVLLETSASSASSSSVVASKPFSVNAMMIIARRARIVPCC